MIESFKDFLISKCSVQEGDSALVALSGGPDSILLTELLIEVGLRVEAAHCNFKLRQEESDEDERFVRQFCDDRSIELHVANFDLSIHDGNIQLEARNLRYNWFSELCERNGFDHIAIGSHLDDRLETAIINLLRITGPAGIRNMKARNGNIIRPLLWASKDDILKEVSRRKLKFRTDSSNLKTDYLRNSIRHDIVPKLKELQPGLLKNFERSAELMQRYEEVFIDSCASFLDRYLKSEKDSECLEISDLLKFRYPGAILFHWLNSYGFNASQLKEIEQACDSNQQQEFNTQNFRLIVDRSELFLLKKSTDKKSDELVEDLPFQSVDHALELDFVPIPNDLKAADRLYLDADKLKFPLRVRTCISGDKIIPLGMSGHKKISDLLTDLKIPARKKTNQPLLVSGDSICAVPPYVISEEFKVSPETERCVMIKLAQAAS